MARLAITLLLSLPVSASAAGNQHFEAARKAWDNFEIDRVLPLLEKAMSAATDLREKTEILELRARVQISQDQSDAARATFVELLGLAPSYTIPESSSPKIRAAFESAQASIQPKEPEGGEPKKEVDMRPVAPAGGTAFWETWWFWTIVGGVVAAGGAALTVALVSSDEPEADLGPFLMR